jgi:hypothetical protein
MKTRGNKMSREFGPSDIENSAAPYWIAGFILKCPADPSIATDLAKQQRVVDAIRACRGDITTEVACYPDFVSTAVVLSLSLQSPEDDVVQQGSLLLWDGLEQLELLEEVDVVAVRIAPATELAGVNAQDAWEVMANRDEEYTALAEMRRVFAQSVEISDF